MERASLLDLLTLMVPAETTSVRTFLEKLDKLSSPGEHFKPHKHILLLTVLELLEGQEHPKNRFYFNDQFRQAFTQNFARYARSSDRNRPYTPFFHLTSSGFWHLKARAGRETILACLSRAGGPSDITENVEYAYLSEDVYALLTQRETANYVRKRLVTMLENYANSGDSRLGLSFHRTFPLRRAGLRQVLELAVSCTADGIDTTKVWEKTSLGTVDAQASCRYAYGVGLLDKSYRPTRFGQLVYQHDPGLAAPNTQWVIHYHMVAPHRSGPAFWHHLAERFFRSGTSFSCRDVADELQEFVAGTSEKAISARTLRTTATIFVGSYAHSDGLSALGILGEPDPVSDEYEVQEPAPPEWSVLAYALADYWRGAWGEQKTVNLDEVTAPGGPADLLLLGSGAARLLLREAQSRGLLQMQRAVAPYHIERMWDDPDSLLEYLYA